MTADLIQHLRERADSGELSKADGSYMRIAADELESLTVWHKDTKPEEKVVVLVSDGQNVGLGYVLNGGWVISPGTKVDGVKLWLAIPTESWRYK